MFSRHIQPMRRALARLAVMVFACASLAGASATLLLEEPYGKLGFFAGTGHMAVYLSDVCADTPLEQRGTFRPTPLMQIRKSPGIRGSRGQRCCEEPPRRSRLDCGRC